MIDKSRTARRMNVIKAVSLLLILTLLRSNSLVGFAAPVAPSGPIAGSVFLPPEAMQAPVDLAGTGKDKRDARLEAVLGELAAAAKVSNAAAAELADVKMARRSGDRVQVQAVTSPDRLEEAKAVISKAGGEVTGVGWGDTLIQGWLPFQALEAVAADPQVDYLRTPEQASLFEDDAGVYTTEGLAVINGPAWHAAGFQGAGVKIAIIDAGFQGYSGLLGSDLPASVTTKNFVDGETDPQVDGSTPHGTACAEIVYDIVPQATLYLGKISTHVDLQEAVTWAKSNGVDVISTSLGWYTLSPGDGTGYFADLVQDARNNGILWATAASNDREAHWGGLFNDTDADDYHQFNGTQEIDYFGPGDGNAYLIEPGYTFRVYLRWDDWSAVNQDYDLYLVRHDGTSWITVAYSASTQDGRPGQKPTEFASYTTSGSAALYGFYIKRYDSNRNVNLEVFAPKITRLDENLHARSISNLADAPEAMTVAALDVNSPYNQESYSSEGPTNGPGGAQGGGFIKPDISGFANVSTVSYGTLSKFSGTSSATPHAAGAAALVQNAYPSYTPAQIETFLESRAVDMGSAGMDTLFGYGRLNLGAPPSTNTAPIITGLPDQAVLVNGSLNNAIDLWTYSSDNESPDSALTFTIHNTPNASAGVSIDSNHYIDISPTTGWTGRRMLKSK